MSNFSHSEFEMFEEDYLIIYSGGLESKASIKNINLSRIVPFENRDEDKVFNRYLTTIDFDTNKELKLIDGDAVEVRSVLAKRLNEVTLQGSVNSEGIYSILKYPDLKSLIQIAGKGIANPIGLKCGPSTEPDDLLRLIEKLNPLNQAGRLTLIARMGSSEIHKKLKPLISAVKRSGLVVGWCSDPMHGNKFSIKIVIKQSRC